MEKILKIISSALIVGLMPFSILVGQDKKSEQKIKIIVDDGSGTTVVVDTIIKDGKEMKSITLKDGNVIFIGDTGDKAGLLTDEGGKKVIVKVSSDGEESKEEVREITILKSDSATWTAEGNSKIFVFTDTKSAEDKTGEDQAVIQRSEKDGNGKGEKVIIIRDGSVLEKNGEESFTYTITSESDKSDFEMTKYVIRKDGMVISIEGSDYEKVKEIADEIESKIDSKKDVSDSKTDKKK